MSKGLKISVAIAALGALAACAQPAEQISHYRGDTRAIRAEEVKTEMSLPAIPGAEQLIDAERDAVRYFAASYKSDGHGPVVISRPAEGASASTMRRVADTRAVLLATGVSPGDISEGGYEANGDAPIILSYMAWEATVPNCPTINEHRFEKTASNGPMPSFGCAVAINLAAMIADPSDLVGDQPMDRSDAARRAIIFEKYRNGEATGAARGDTDGSISNAIN